MESINKSDNNFEQCLKCTICTVYCPVLAVNPDFPGPKHGGPDQERLRLKMPSFYDEANKYCMNCKRCEVACPSNVRVGDIIQKAKLKYSRHKPSLRDFFLSHTDLVGTLSSPFAPIVNKVLSSYTSCWSTLTRNISCFKSCANTVCSNKHYFIIFINNS